MINCIIYQKNPMLKNKKVQEELLKIDIDAKKILLIILSSEYCDISLIAKSKGLTYFLSQYYFRVIVTPEDKMRCIYSIQNKVSDKIYEIPSKGEYIKLSCAEIESATPNKNNWSLNNRLIYAIYYSLIMDEHNEDVLLLLANSKIIPDSLAQLIADMSRGYKVLNALLSNPALSYSFKEKLKLSL